MTTQAANDPLELGQSGLDLALPIARIHGEPMTQGPVSIAAHSGALFDSFLPRKP